MTVHFYLLSFFEWTFIFFFVYIKLSIKLPHVFIGGESIGGLSTGTPGLQALLESGELETKLKAAKALKK